MGKPANKVYDGTATAADAATTGAPTDDGAAGERNEFPCSPAQERFWLLDRLDPGNSSYNVAVRWRLEGRVATDLLEQAWLQIIERHEVLRTVFVEVDGAPLQRVMPRASFRLNEIDLSNLAPDLQQAEGDRIGIIEARAPFDVSSGPLIRVTLLRFSSVLSIILVTTHQIVSDGWSIGVMAREMGLIYDALRHARPVALEPLAVQYADYSEWQLEWLRVRGTEAETAYWTRQLAGVKPFKVIADHPRPAMPTTNGHIVSRLLPRELTNRAQALSAQRGATLFATAFAALCAALARFTNEPEIVVGTQVSGRDQVELETMIGQFVNSLILRNDLSGDPAFSAIVDGVRDTIAQALEYRHIPIERLLGMVKSERTDANTPPISVNFIFQKTFITNTQYGDFALIDMPSLPAGAIYDLNLFMVERPDGWRFSCQYNTDQFERATAERLLGYVERLLDGAVANPSLRLSELPLAAPEEARELLAKLNDTRALYPRELNLGQLFDAQAARAPEAVAVMCGDRTLSYGDLHIAANRLAADLRAQGVATAGARIGVCLGPSAELPIALLAVLKAGVTIVPMDPQDPPARLADLVRLTGVSAVIGRRQQQRPENRESGPKFIDVETALIAAAAAPAGAALAGAGADSAAILTLESGIDDAARVVGMSHRSLANLVFAAAKRPGVNHRDVVVQASTPGSGQAIFETFLPLLTGARLVMPQGGDLANGRTLLHLLQRSSATLLYGPAQLWWDLLDANWIGFPALKILCPATDLTARLIERLTATGGELWSLFGVADAGIWSAVRLVKPAESPGLLGEPIANTSLLVLEPSLRTAPVGVVGQLYLSGDGLSERAQSTALLGESGTRVHPTGCVARLKSTGDIEYLGRLDDRVWLRGMLLDPREIETALLRDPAVAEAVVISIRDAREVPVAQAFVVPRATADPAAQAAALERSLAASLPAQLLPASIVVRESLPRLGDGNIDRLMLRNAKARASRSAVLKDAGSDIENRLAGVWSTMLGAESVGPADNFFELGGHSLLAARMLTQVEREFGKRIKLATLFLAPTLREFAGILSQAETREFDFRQVVKIQPHGSKRPLIAINNTGIYYSLAKGLGAERPVYSLQLFDPSVRDTALPETLEEIAAGYVGLIRRVQPQGPYELMGWCVAGALAFEIARQLTAERERVAHLFLIDSWVPGYFQRLPALRRVLGLYSLRAQLIIADWRRVLASEKSIGDFIRHRTAYKRLMRLVQADRGNPSGAAAGASSGGPAEVATPETYDAWLLAYLQRVTAKYTPKMFDGAITLLRSRLEPTGWFFEQDAGWGAFSRSGAEVLFVDGNHFTMFQEPGSRQMAAHVASTLEAPRDDVRRDPPPGP